MPAPGCCPPWGLGPSPVVQATDLASLKELLHNAEGYDWIDIENFMRYFNLYPSQARATHGQAS